MLFYAYMHCRPDGTPFYVGKGNKARVSRLKRQSNPHHSNIIKKYGPDNILVGSVECSSEEVAFSLEAGLIKRLKAMGVRLSNLTEGGEGVSGLKMSDGAKAKMRAAKVGKHLTEEHKKKIGLSQVGKTMSLESREKVKIARLGMKFTAEHRKKLSAAKIGRKLSDQHIQKVRESILGRHWITDGFSSKMVRNTEVLPVGWRLGRTFEKGAA